MSIQTDRCCLSVCHKTDIVKHTDTVITAWFMLLHPFMSLSQLANEWRILMLLIKADIFFSCLGSDAHEPVNHLFLGFCSMWEQTGVCSEARGNRFKGENSELEVCAKHLFFLLNFQLWAASDLLLYCCHACKYEDSRSLVVSDCLFFAITASLQLGATSCCKTSLTVVLVISYWPETNVKCLLSSLWYSNIKH